MPKANYRNNANQGYDLCEEEGQTSKFLQVSIKISNLPKINPKDPEELEERINTYFQICADFDFRPTVSGLGLAIGLDRRRIYEIRTDRNHRGLPPEAVVSIKKAYGILENLMENYLLNGKINPICGIFLAKNHFGYVDKQEIQLGTTADSEEPTDFKKLESKYTGNIVLDSADYQAVNSDDSGDFADSENG